MIFHSAKFAYRNVICKLFKTLGVLQMFAEDFSLRFAPFEMTIVGKVYGEEGISGKAADAFLPPFSS